MKKIIFIIVVVLMAFFHFDSDKDNKVSLNFKNDKKTVKTTKVLKKTVSKKETASNPLPSEHSQLKKYDYVSFEGGISNEEYIETCKKNAREGIEILELLLCTPKNSLDCYHKMKDNETNCVLIKGKCDLSYPVSIISEEEMLNFIPPQIIIDNLIEREKLTNYEKNPVENGTNMYDQEYYDRKLVELNSQYGIQEDTPISSFERLYFNRMPLKLRKKMNNAKMITEWHSSLGE